MSVIFCCSSISPYRPRQLDHEAKFKAFMRWAYIQMDPVALVDGLSLVKSVPYAIQLVRQINHGPQESVRYFIPTANDTDFVEAMEDHLLKWNFEKVNSYKNFRCEKHNKFFEVNLYQKSPTNTHHWRVNLARPSRDIDLAFRRRDSAAEQDRMAELSTIRREKQELPGYGIQGEGSSPELAIPPPQGLQESVSLQKTRLENQLDTASLRKALQLLLPNVVSNLGSSRLLTLLSLDWVNTELDLGLKFESVWEVELTSANITEFLDECIASFNPSPGAESGAVEDLVIPAMRHVELRLNKQRLSGKTRLHEVVNRVLASGCQLAWVSQCEASIVRMFVSGPGELLDLQQNSHIPQGQKNENPRDALGTQSEKVIDVFSPWKPQNEHDDDDPEYYYDNYGIESDHESMKDFAACDKECGYCGHCDY